MNFDIIPYLPFIRILAIVVVGLPLVMWLSRYVQNKLSRYMTPHFTVLVSQAIFYAGMVLIAITVLKNLGFELSAFLGTAGIVGITLGFAAQTSISNIISGVFLLIEDTFQVGDTITTNYFSGKVKSVHIFSILLRTEDEKTVRVPNEFLLKNPITIKKR